MPLALTLTARAASLSAAVGLLRLGARQDPISSMRLMSAESLEDLRMRLACTCGVGARQGRTAGEVEDGLRAGRGAAQAGGGRPVPGWRGRSEESLAKETEDPPPSVGVQVRQLLALCVTTPRRQAACAAAVSALRRKEDTALGAARLMAAALARESTNLLARQSREVRGWPLLLVATPMEACDLCAGIQTNLPVSTMVERSSPTTCAMRVQILASGLSWWVALAVPARAVSRSAWQSVRMGGTKGQCVSTESMAQASAEAAVSHQEGGQPSL